MTAEEWRPVPGFPDYQVSSLGQIASVKRGERQILTGGKTEMGYRNVLLYTNGVRAGRRVHQLVALTFLGPRPDGLEIRHLDGDQLNNAVSNLAYGTREENVWDKRLHRGRLLIVGFDPIPAHRPGTYCVHGHERTASNTFVASNGNQKCRPCQSTCESASRRRRKERLRAAGIRAA